MKRLKKVLIGAGIVAMLGGCATPGMLGNNGNVSVNESSTGVLVGPQVSSNDTIQSGSLMCVGDRINNVIRPKNKVRISVGDIPDMTGKYDEGEGYRITQGAALMVTTALGKTNAVQIVERQDTGVFTFEMDLADRKIIGDQQLTKLPNGKVINYRPVVSGSVTGSEYYITGGVTEANFNIRSNGFEADVSGFGGGVREYVMNVAMDLRLVNAKTLDVVKTVSLQKQVVGYETKAGIFRFFGVELVDINTGSKVDEPLQLGIRAVAEQGVGELLAGLYNFNPAVYYEEHYTDDVTIREPRVFATEVICPGIQTKVAKTEAKVIRKRVEKQLKILPVAPVARAIARKDPRTVQPVRYGGACAVNGCTSAHCYVEVDNSKEPRFGSRCDNKGLCLDSIDEPETGLYVQMSSFRTFEGNRHEWACLETGKTTKGLFANEEYIIKEEEDRKGWKTLLVGPQKSMDSAATLCMKAKQRGLDCLVRRIE